MDSRDDTQEIKINLTFGQIYEGLCQKCKDKFLEMAASEGVKQAQQGAKQIIVESLRKNLT